MITVIDTENMSKRFGEITAVDGIHLSIPKGEIFGLLGPNAAGKSTVIRLLSGILDPDSGGARVLGYDLVTEREKIKASIGYVAQSFALYPELTVAENLDFYSAIYVPISKESQEKLLQEYGLEKFSNHRAGLLSGGYKRRLSIACALAHDPELIFLDEPTAGIDPVTRKELWEQFYILAAKGKTLFVTTHYMEEAERCNRLAFIHHGRVVAQGSPSTMISSFVGRNIYTAPTRHSSGLAAALLAMPGVQVLNQFGDQLRIITDASLKSGPLEAAINRQCGGHVKVRQVQPDIEDVFISLTHEEKPS
ncbi:MAG: ABC transporter ATP-binding protein [Mariprofundaceae bacterium]|nr:ABC transporter ATP-binding protein [Mariprofundaceae bacterium]